MRRLEIAAAILPGLLVSPVRQALTGLDHVQGEPLRFGLMAVIMADALLEAESLAVDTGAVPVDGPARAAPAHQRVAREVAELAAALSELRNEVENLRRNSR